MITAEAQLRAGIVPLCSKPSRDARLGARRKRFHPLTAPAPRRRGGVGTKGVPTFRPRLRRIEQRAFRLLKALDAARALQAFIGGFTDAEDTPALFP
jgi:hypothetical protein